MKRKHTTDDDIHASARSLKKPRVKVTDLEAPLKIHATRRSRTPTPTPLPAINKAPTAVLDVLVFGNGDAGELGLGPAIQEACRPRLNPFLDPRDPSALHIVQLACGGMHTVGLTENNTIVTWGVNDNFALGRSTAWEGGLREIDGADGSEDGELNPLESTPTPIPANVFPEGTRFVQVAAGDSCTFALTDKGEVFGWGTFKNLEGKERFGYDTSGQIIEKQASPTHIRGLKNITHITCGSNHALALDKDGVVWAWGCNEQQQLGRSVLGRHAKDPFTPDAIKIRDVKHIACGEYHSLAVDKKGHVWAWGLNSFGQAGYPETAGSDETLLPFPMKISSLAAKLGIRFTPEQLLDAKLIRYDERGKPRICLVPTPVPGIGKVSHVACGTDHTLFVTREGEAYATGFNSQGQLGLGHEDDVEVAQLIRGRGLQGRAITWAAAGGQFSVLAARSRHDG